MENMKAMRIVSEQNGDGGSLELTRTPRPVPQHREVLIQVVAAGVNRADVMQRQGNYPRLREPANCPVLKSAGASPPSDPAATVMSCPSGSRSARS